MVVAPTRCTTGVMADRGRRSREHPLGRILGTGDRSNSTPDRTDRWRNSFGRRPNRARAGIHLRPPCASVVGDWLVCDSVLRLRLLLRRGVCPNCFSLWLKPRASHPARHGTGNSICQPGSPRGRGVALPQVTEGRISKRQIPNSKETPSSGRHWSLAEPEMAHDEGVRGPEFFRVFRALRG